MASKVSEFSLKQVTAKATFWLAREIIDSEDFKASFLLQIDKVMYCLGNEYLKRMENTTPCSGNSNRWFWKLILNVPSPAKWMVPPKVSHCQKNCIKLQHSVMKFDHSNKFDLCYYGQVNSLRLKSSVALKWASKHILAVTFILQAIVRQLKYVNWHAIYVHTNSLPSLIVKLLYTYS